VPLSDYQSMYLADLAAPQRERVHRLIQEMEASVTAWTAGYSLIRAARISLCCLHGAATLSCFPAREVSCWVKLMLWIFAIDDLTDEHLLDPDATKKIFAECRTLLARQRGIEPETGPAGFHHLSACLASIIAELQRYPLFTHNRGQWADSITDCLWAMETEEAWNSLFRKDSRQLPSLEEYILQSAKSICITVFADSIIAMAGDDSALAKYGWLRELSQQACVVIRLANDLRSHPRELQERKVNALIIKHAERLAGGLFNAAALDAARSEIAAMLRQELDKLEQIYKADATATTHPENSIISNVRFMIEFYSRRDF
jgi:hypothetical protein